MFISNLIEYLDSIKVRDPAPRTRWEILLYPGVWAVGPNGLNGTHPSARAAASRQITVPPGPATAPVYLPSMSDLMTSAVQSRHTKLGLAIKARNWAYLGYEVRVDNIARSDLYIADEIFVCGTAAEVSSVNSVDDRKVPCPGPATRAIADVYAKAVRGQDARYTDWLEHA